MIEFLRRLFGHQGSSTTAKERLRLVLMTDHLELAPDMIDTMKRELVEVISRFVEVDRERIDVTFERQDSTLAMLANIPIVSVTRPSGNGASNGNGSSNGNAAPKAEAPAAQAPLAAPAPAAETAKPPSRKRRRKKKAAQSAAPAPAH